MFGAVRDKIVGSTTSLFSHGPKALEHTLEYKGDPGLLGPESVSWRVIGDAAASRSPSSEIEMPLLASAKTGTMT